MPEPLPQLPPAEDARVLGGRTAFFWALGTGVISFVGIGLFLHFTPGQMLHSYLASYVYWAGLSFGALVWLTTLHTAKTKWAVSVRRLLEILAGTVGLFLVLFVPIGLGMKELYPWARPEELSAHERYVVTHNYRYLNVTGWVMRTVVHYLLCIFVSGFLLRSSRAQDRTRDIRWTLWQRRLSAVSLPFLGVGLTLIAFDWLMSLEPSYRSTVFGLYYFAGNFVGAMALLIVAVYLAERAGPLRGLVNQHHYHTLGKLLFAFVCFWAYIAFSQYLLQYMANLPGSEIPFYLLRQRHGWTGVSQLLVIGHFVVPFCILLSADLKKHPKRLVAVSLWILFVHWVDDYWLVMPFFDETPRLHVQDLFAFLGIGGLAVAFFLLRLRNDYAAPVGDPYFEESVAFRR
jgi:hypothetical protein